MTTKMENDVARPAVALVRREGGTKASADLSPALIAILALILLTARSGWLGRQSSDILFYTCAFGQAALALLATRLALGSRYALVPVVITAVALRLAFLPTVPNLSGDIYRYIWDGRIVGAGFNPYLHVPADPILAALRDPAQYGLIDKRDYAVTIYPPVAEAFFALVTALSGSVLAMKTAMVLCEGVAVLAMARLLDRLGRPRALLTLYLLHPAPLWEIAGNGHVDAAMMAFVGAAFAWTGGTARPYLSAGVMTLGALVKPTAALGLPSFWRPFDLRLPAFVLAMTALCYAPFLSAGRQVIGFLPNYAHEQGLDSGTGFFALALLKAAGLERPWMAAAYAGVAALILLATALWTRRRGDARLVTALGGMAMLVMVFLMLLTPVFPWYFLVALPFVPMLGLWSPFALSTGGFLLYAFNADAPGFLARWCVLMALVLAAAARDVRAWRGRDDEIHDAR